MSDPFTSSVPGALTRTVQGKLDEIVSVLDFGADPTGATDSTDAFNAALEAAAAYIGNETPLKRRVVVPRGKYKLGGDDKTVFVRKGQHLAGEGLGCYLDLAATGANSNPIFRLGAGEDYVDTPGGDPGGLGAEISGIWCNGGPASAAVVDTTEQAGWWIYNMFFTSCGIGVKAGGGDGNLHHCQFDQGLVAVTLDGANININNCNMYSMNYAFIALSAYDVLVANCQIEYPQYTGVQLGSGSPESASINGIKFIGCTFTMNAQFETFEGYFAFAGSNIRIDVDNCLFHNCPGYAVRHLTGLDSVAVFNACVFDGTRTNPVYDQGTTMGGIEVAYMDLTLNNCVFRNLPGQPIRLKPGNGYHVTVRGCSFAGNTGGTTEIRDDATDGGTRLSLYSNGWTYDGRQLVNRNSVTKVHAPYYKSGRATLVGGVATVAEPMSQTGAIIQVERIAESGTVGIGFAVSATSGSFDIYSRTLNSSFVPAIATADVSTVAWIAHIEK